MHGLVGLVVGLGIGEGVIIISCMAVVLQDHRRSHPYYAGTDPGGGVIK